MIALSRGLLNVARLVSSFCDDPRSSGARLSDRFGSFLGERARRDVDPRVTHSRGSTVVIHHSAYFRVSHYFRDRRANEPPLTRNTTAGLCARVVRGTRGGPLYYDDFSRALHLRTMETGKTIERQARGSLSLLNNFCVLKNSIAPPRHRRRLCRPCRRPRRHNFRLGAGIRPSVESSDLSRLVAVFDGANDREEQLFRWDLAATSDPPPHLCDSSTGAKERSQSRSTIFHTINFAFVARIAKRSLLQKVLFFISAKSCAPFEGCYLFFTFTQGDNCSFTRGPSDDTIS